MLDSSRMVELAALIAYLAVLLWIGLGSARRIRTSTDYTLAGRNVPWVVLLATTAATLIGGGASVGTVARVYEIGVAAALITCAWHLQLIFTGLWAAPRLRRLDLVTVADFFELKFGRVARVMATAHCLLFLVGALVAQMAAMATITASTAGIPYGAALLIGAAVTIFYSTVGGMRAVVATDVLQFVILVGGMAAASGMLIYEQGGFLPLARAGRGGPLPDHGPLVGYRRRQPVCGFSVGRDVHPHLYRPLLHRPRRPPGQAGSGRKRSLPAAVSAHRHLCDGAFGGRPA